MIFSFTGDVILQELEKYNDDPFKEIKSELNNSYLVINLESPFINEKCQVPKKDKVTLYQYEKSVNYLKKLNPSLISLSNNHINDFGDESVDLTKSVLSENSFKYLGVGSEKDQSHIFIDENEKTIFIAYTTRETDLTKNFLHANYERQGPKDIDLEEIRGLKLNYNDYKLSILIHWGVEYRELPLPSLRERAHQLIEAGADLIVGHHSHIIHPYEIYKGKYIFYSLGNFIFPDINYKLLNGQSGTMKQNLIGRRGLLCKFDIKNNKLHELLILERDNSCNLKKIGEYNKMIAIKSMGIYKLVYKFYELKYKIKEFITVRVPRIPGKIMRILKMADR